MSNGTEVAQIVTILPLIDTSQTNCGARDVFETHFSETVTAVCFISSSERLH